MGRSVVSFVFAVTTLAGALWFYFLDQGGYGGLLYPMLGLPAVVVMMGLRASVSRRGRAGPNATAAALQLLALSVLLAPIPGVWSTHYHYGQTCGLKDGAAALTALGMSCRVWVAGELAVLITLGFRAASLRRLRPSEAFATVVTLLTAPPLVALACTAVAFESERGGAGVTFMLPAAVAAGSTVVAWMVGCESAISVVLRRLATLTLVIGAFVSLAARSQMLPAQHDCVSYMGTTTWGLLADVGVIAAPLLAVVLFFTRDPPAAAA